MKHPVYELAKPVSQCGVCFRKRRFTFVIAHENVPLMAADGSWEDRVQLTRICSPTCASHFAEMHDCPLYDRHGMEVTEWLRSWRSEQDEGAAA